MSGDWLESEAAEVTAWHVRAVPALVALVDSLAKRPGGWSVPVRATCAGHETGAVFQLSADGDDVAVRARVLSPVTVPADEDNGGSALLLTCRNCGRELLRNDRWVVEQIVRALSERKAGGGQGRARFKWS